MSNVDVRNSNDAIGIQFGPDRITGCRATKTMLGSVKYQYADAIVTDGDLNTALADSFGFTRRRKKSATDSGGDSDRRVLLRDASDRIRLPPTHRRVFFCVNRCEVRQPV